MPDWGGDEDSMNSDDPDESAEINHGDNLFDVS
jgi:hypothetical protein